MRKIIGIVAVLVCLAGQVWAEPATITWTEPVSAGTLAFTTVYWCLGTGCTDWKTGPEFRRGSDNGNGGDAKSHVLNVPLTEGTLPVVLRVKITATDTSNNETAGVIDTHTFTE